MARQRRGGGFRPPELRGTLGTLLRTTLAQAGTLRDVLERGAREGRSRLDSALSNRRRTDALAELGEVVLDLIRRGEIDVDELPEARDIVAHLDDIDSGAHDEELDDSRAAPPARNRFDARRRDTHDASGDDGTVTSQTWSRPRGAPKPAAARVWRPPADDADADADASRPSRPDEETTAREKPPTPARRGGTLPGAGARSGRGPSSGPGGPNRGPGTGPRSGAGPLEQPIPTPKRKDPARKGGIHFDDDDEDLSEYMHPDDVPPKGTPGGDS